MVSAKAISLGMVALVGLVPPVLAKDVRDLVDEEGGLRKAALSLRRTHLKTLNKRYTRTVPSETTKHRRERDQSQTGRSWLFAATNMIESGFAPSARAKANLSESYLYLQALRTRAFSALDRVPRLKDPIKSWVGEGIDIGGHVAWASQLIAKHGVVPESVMPDTIDPHRKALLVTHVNELILAAQSDLRKTRPNASRQRREIKARYRREINTLLETELGSPKESFKIGGKIYTPKSYAEKVARFDPKEFVVLSNLPADGMALNSSYRVPGTSGHGGFNLFNVSTDKMARAVRKAIDLGVAVPFTANVSSNVDRANPYIVKTSDRVPPQAKGIMHVGAFDYRSLLGFDTPSKRVRFSSGLDLSTHTMTFVGHDGEEGRGEAKKFQVNHNWLSVPTTDWVPRGKGSGWTGRMDMYSDFFKQYVTTVVVPRSALSATTLKQIDASSKHPKKLRIDLPVPE